MANRRVHDTLRNAPTNAGGSLLLEGAHSPREAQSRPKTPVASVLLIDDEEPFLGSLNRSLTSLNFSVHLARSFEAAHIAIDVHRPTYVISELRVGRRSLVDFLPDVISRIRLDRLFVATVYPSVATAVRLVRMGVAGYVTKPVSCLAIVEMLGGNLDSADVACDDQLKWPTLDRTIWEYLCQVHATTGSLSSAARCLGLDRRSLRRMLAKYPPAR